MKKRIVISMQILLLVLTTASICTPARADGCCGTETLRAALTDRKATIDLALGRMGTLHEQYHWTLAAMNLAAATALASAVIPTSYVALGLLPEAVGYFTQMSLSGAAGGLAWASAATGSAYSVDSLDFKRWTENFNQVLHSPGEVSVTYIKLRETILQSRDSLLTARPRESGFFDEQVERFRDQEIRILATRALSQSFGSEIQALERLDVRCDAQSARPKL